MYLHIRFCQDPTIFDKVRILVEKHNLHMNHFGSGGVIVIFSRQKNQNGRQSGHIGFSINVKTTQYEYAHQAEYLYKISRRLNYFENAGGFPSA